MELKTIENILFKYIRNEKNHPIGIVAAIGKNKVGWSMCHKDDKWDREMGKTIAINRAWKGFNVETNIEKAPHCMKNAIKDMYLRSEKYYNR